MYSARDEEKKFAGLSVTEIWLATSRRKNVSWHLTKFYSKQCEKKKPQSVAGFPCPVLSYLASYPENAVAQNKGSKFVTKQWGSVTDDASVV